MVDKIFTTFIVLALSIQVTQVRYAGGTGIPEDPYQIAAAQQLIKLGERRYGCGNTFTLTAGIDLDGLGSNLDGSFPHAIIAPDISDIKHGFRGTRFNGQFLGNSHVIRNLKIKNHVYYSKTYH